MEKLNDSLFENSQIIIKNFNYQIIDLTKYHENELTPNHFSWNIIKLLVKTKPNIIRNIS